jgi:hypothetical protein
MSLVIEKFYSKIPDLLSVMLVEEEESCPVDMFILYGLLSARYVYK